MILEIEGINVKIIYSETSTAALLSYSEELMTIRLPALLPKDELKEIIKNFKKQKYSDHLQAFNGDYLYLFQKKIPIRWVQSNNFQPYLRDQIIYLSVHQAKFINSSLFIEKLKVLLLKNLVVRSVGHWEETFSILINQVNFRKLKTKLYTTCLKKNCITFNIALVNQVVEVIDYIALDAVLHMCAIKKTEYETIKNKYIPNWKSFQKIIDHESTNESFDY